MEVTVKENSLVDVDQPVIEAMNLVTISPEILLLILDQLDSKSTTTFCQVNKYCNNIVRMYKHLLRSKLFKFDQHQYQMIRPIYTNFGKYISKLSLVIIPLQSWEVEPRNLPLGFNNRFNNMLQMIIDHFEPNALVDLSLRLKNRWMKNYCSSHCHLCEIWKN